MEKALRYLSEWAILAVGFTVFSCGHSGSSALPEASSVSGAMAGAVGSALSQTNPSGTIPMNAVLTWPGRKFAFEFIPEALASAPCPTIKSTSGLGCTTVSNTSLMLSYASCSRGKGGQTSSTGTYEYQVSGTGWTLACGAGVGGSGASYVIGSSFSNSTGTAGSTGTYKTALGTTLNVDHSSAGLGNYQNDSLTAILTNVTPGAGNSVTFTNGVRTGVALHTRITITLAPLDYGLTTNGTPLSVAESAGATTRSVSGSAIAYDNITKVKGTTTFTNVSYQDNCCSPVSGVVTTQFTATSLSGTAGQALNGKTETLTFKGCGTGSFTDTSGTASSVTVDWCI